MAVDDLDISKGALRMLSLLKIADVSELLRLNWPNLQSIRAKNKHYCSYFDEIFAAVKDLGLSFVFENDYYINLGSRKANLANIRVEELILTPQLRNFLEPYGNLEAFFKDIANDNSFYGEQSKKKLKRFLVTTIKANQNYDWLINLLRHLGNKGALLALIIEQYMSFLNQREINANSLLSNFILDKHIVIALNKQDIYFLGDLVQLDIQTVSLLNGIGKKSLKTIQNDLSKYGFKLGEELPNYYDFTFAFNKFDIRILHLQEKMEANLRKVGVNTLNDLIVVEYAKYFSDYDNQIITDSYRKLGFDWENATFNKTINGTYAEANEWLQELKRLREMYSVRMAILEKNSSFIGRYFPTTIPVLNSQNYQELIGTTTDLMSVSFKNLKIPRKIQDYLQNYEIPAIFFYTIANDKTYEKDKSKNHLKRFLLKNIKPDENYQGLVKTLRSLGNDGILLSLIILKYQSFLQQKTVNLNMPVSKIITSKKIVTALLFLNIYFIGDLVKHTKDELVAMEGLGINYLKEIEDDLSRYNYKLGSLADSYDDFSFNMANFDIKVLGLSNDLETRLREIGINNLADLITSKDSKFWLEPQNKEILLAYRKLGFMPMQGFSNPIVNSNYNETNQCLLELDLLIARYNELLIKTYKYNISLQDTGKSIETNSNNSGFGRC